VSEPAPERGRGISLLPSAVTVLALCLGLSSVKFALDGQLGTSYALVAAAAVLDALDGRIARLLDVSSRIGAELDSLADAISFGVSPALVLYLTVLDGSRAGWVVTLVFVVCTVLRLARYNTLIDDDTKPPYASEFFTGVPSPSGAMLALVPIPLQMVLGEGWWSSAPVVGIWVVAVAALVVSRLPTLSVNSIRVPSRLAAPFLVLVGATIAGLIVFPYLVVLLLTAAYLAHLPLATRRWRWLGAHPEVWDVAPAQRKAVRQLSRRRLGLRPPRVRRLAGRRRP
jgi:CDP-diacylglycerol--serine O-phosphatidyltransferase